jgi:hypothetical protein
VLWVGSIYFVRLLRLFRIRWRAARLGCGLKARDKFTLEEISALLGISELQFVIDCLMEATRDGIGGLELEPI